MSAEGKKNSLYRSGLTAIGAMGCKHLWAQWAHLWSGTCRLFLRLGALNLHECFLSTILFFIVSDFFERKNWATSWRNSFILISFTSGPLSNIIILFFISPMNIGKRALMYWKSSSKSRLRFIKKTFIMYKWISRTHCKNPYRKYLQIHSIHFICNKLSSHFLVLSLSVNISGFALSLLNSQWMVCLMVLKKVVSTSTE